jgi:hypothetical protein
MIIIIDRDTTVNQLRGGLVVVTKPGMTGKITSHVIKSCYSAFHIAGWLYNRIDGKAMIVQEAFPDMSDEDREFLMTGITPSEWERMFPKEDVQ